MKCLVIFLAVTATVCINLLVPAPALTFPKTQQAISACPQTDTLCPTSHLDRPDVPSSAPLQAAWSDAINFVYSIKPL